MGPSGSKQVLADMRKSIKLKIVHEILFFLVSNITVDHKGTRKSGILINFGKLSQKFYWEKKIRNKKHGKFEYFENSLWTSFHFILISICISRTQSFLFQWENTYQYMDIKPTVLWKLVFAFKSVLPTHPHLEIVQALWRRNIPLYRAIKTLIPM